MNSSTGTATNGATSLSGERLAKAKTARSESIASANAKPVRNSAVSEWSALVVEPLAPRLSGRVSFISL